MDEANEQNISTDTEPTDTYIELDIEESDIEPSVNWLPDWAFLLWWVVGNIAGIIIGAILAQGVTGSIWSSPGEVSDNALIAGLLLGGIIGLFEWFVLSSYVADMGWWIVATSIGWAVAWVLNFNSLESNRATIMNAAAIGAAISIA